MKTSVLTTLIENLSRIREFIPEKEMLTERVVENLMKSLRKQLAAERAILAAGGFNTDATTALVNDPQTVVLLRMVADATLRYYDHVDMMEKIVDAGSTPN